MINVLPQISFSFFLLHIGTIIGCSDGSTPIDSRWSESSIVIDGKINDWDTTTNDKESMPSYTFQNDSDHLYILFRPTKQILRQAMMFGFTIWFDTKVGKQKRLGIRFPIGMMNYTNGNISPMDMVGNEFSDSMKQRILKMLQTFDILYPKEDEEFRFSNSLSDGIGIALNDSTEAPVYEMKIPLRKINPKDIPLNNSFLPDPIYVGFELGMFDRSIEIFDSPRIGILSEETDFEHRKGMGRLPVGGIAQQNSILDAWFKVHLSSTHE